jgi:hypothetical protein
MTRLATILLLLALVHPASADCGEERADVKLGLDAEAAKVEIAPTDTTIAELVALPVPRHPMRRAPAELRTWRVSATLIAYKLEADSDYHLVVTDDHDRTMIVEIPSVECSAASPWAAAIATARAVMDNRRPGKKLRHTSIPVVVTGVGFFDKIHGQVGVAPNGIELHPVLAIELGGGK